MTADLTTQSPYQDIQVENDGNDTAYVAITVYRVSNPGQPNQNFTPLGDNPYQIGLIVTPNKMVIPAGQMRIVRALYIGAPVQSDAIYEVKFTPVSGQLVAIGNTQQVAVGVNVIIAYGVTLFVRPATLHPNINAVRNDKELTLSNIGNTSVLIGNCKQCSADHCNIPTDVTARLFPGNTVHLTLPQNLPVQCQEEILQNQFNKLTIN